MREELLNGLTEEQIAKIKTCKNSEEMLAVAKEEGIELTDEQLEVVSGGCGTSTTSKIKSGGGVCPICHCHQKYLALTWRNGRHAYHCYRCDKYFYENELYTG